MDRTSRLRVTGKGGSPAGESGSGWWMRSSDLILAALVIAIIALMVLPLPRWLIDSLVAVNMCIGIMLVLMGIYIRTALQFSSFPSVLLISTLFRLALSVATTRMILLHGDAGAIIETFGKLVAGGNLVVGLVVFLIITVVQFLVIAKGAERVAEVGARFTLDAMPGKQLSIDSDLRSGLMDKHEARAKRRELELESKLHGSMDGAMKFVKGDAIAGIVIILVNLLGGLAIGVFQLNMSMGGAMSKYSILTIGDGLVAQIPALLGAMAAGLIVTRSTDTESGEHLATSIQKQVSSIPRVSMVAGAACLLFAAVPGFPTGVFIILALMLGLSGALLVPETRLRLAQLAPASFDAVLERQASRRRPVAPTRAEPVSPSEPLLFHVPRDLAGSGRDEALRDAISDEVDAFQQRTGVPLPKVQFRWQRVDPAGWQLDAFDVPIAGGEWSLDGGTEPILERIEQALDRQATLFLGIQEATQLMAIASNDFPDIVKEAQRLVPIQNIAVVLRLLVEEGIPIRNLRAILESLVQYGTHEKDAAELAEFARIALSRQTCHRLAPDNTLRVIGLGAALEEQLSTALRASGNTRQLALDPALIERIQTALVSAVRRSEPAAMLTNAPLRRHVRRLLARDCFELPVLSYNELLPTLKLDVAEQVTLEDAVPLSVVK